MSNDIAQGIREAAAALGMPPQWLATYISYETAGTFDPVKKGPTTKWGLHKGLIQFGEPQAMQYGVDWSNPVGSQLGANGAVVKYFKDRGWKPGMSFTDGYSIINAGGPGRHSASDEKAGGAPGTVADKVAGMQPHYEKATAFLGMSGSDMEPENRNGTISAQFMGETYKTDLSTSNAAESVRDPKATASSERDRSRGPRRNPFYEALEVSYVDPVSDLLSDPNRDGPVQALYRR
jgi:hypothetical protein